ncbi:MAG: type I methionyl aminopeptidase [Hyphomicrobiaceae bacterium]|nr:type I methionyl aminopeptidase [Hyphomicrobiaceae bacterium]
MSEIDFNHNMTCIRNNDIPLHGHEAFEGMRKAGKLAAEVLDILVPYVKPGVTTEFIDDLVYNFAMDNSVIPATLNYRGYPKSCCTSINHVVCHGIPGPKALRKGDILNIDVTLIVDGWHGDTSRMYAVGPISRKAERLIKTTYECLKLGINSVKPGHTTGDIGEAIQTYAEKENFSVVRDFCGHGVGQIFHDKPNILHYGKSGEGHKLKPGMFFTIEPMINSGRSHVKILPDGWTSVTRDRELSAQFEHTVGVTENGYEVFTYSPAGFHCPPFEIDNA